MLSLSSFFWVPARACRSAWEDTDKDNAESISSIPFFILSHITCISHKPQRSEVMAALREQTPEQEAIPWLLCDCDWSSFYFILFLGLEPAALCGSACAELRDAKLGVSDHRCAMQAKPQTAFADYSSTARALICISTKPRPLEAPGGVRVPLSGAIWAGRRGFATPRLAPVCVFLRPGAGT